MRRQLRMQAAWEASRTTWRKGRVNARAGALVVGTCSRTRDAADLLFDRLGGLPVVRFAATRRRGVACGDACNVHVRTWCRDRRPDDLLARLDRLAHAVRHRRRARRRLRRGVRDTPRLTAARGFLARAVSCVGRVCERTAGRRLRRDARRRDACRHSRRHRLLRRDLLPSCLRAGLGQRRPAGRRSIHGVHLLRQQLRALFRCMDCGARRRVRAILDVVVRLAWGARAVRGG